MGNTIPLVSVCCITYNQKNYIREAIEGFFNVYMAYTNIAFFQSFTD